MIKSWQNLKNYWKALENEHKQIETEGLLALERRKLPSLCLWLYDFLPEIFQFTSMIYVSVYLGLLQFPFVMFWKFQSTGLEHSWLNLLLTILFFWCYCEWSYLFISSMLVIQWFLYKVNWKKNLFKWQWWSNWINIRKKNEWDYLISIWSVSSK